MEAAVGKKRSRSAGHAMKCRSRRPQRPACARLSTHFRHATAPKDMSQGLSLTCPEWARRFRTWRWLETEAVGRGQRALRQPRPCATFVVLARRDVVRRAGIEEARECLDVQATDAELELTAAVHRDLPCGAVIDRVQQTLDRTEPRRLDVHIAGAALLDVRDRMDRGIPAQSLLRATQRLARLVGQRRILDDRLRKGLRDRTVEARVRRLVDDRAVVLALQVEHADVSCRGDLAHVLVAPLARRIELELQFRVQLEPGPDLESRRDDEAHRTVLASERPAEREAVLAQREVEAGALERPAPVVLEAVLVEAARVVRERHASALAERREAVVRLRLVGDVLTVAGLARAHEDHRRRHAREVGRHGRLTPLRRERLDLELEPAHRVVERHPCHPIHVQLHVLAAAVAAALPIHGTVVPGRSLGGLRIGDPAQRVAAAWGTRYAVCHGCPRTTWYYNYTAYEPQGAAVEFQGRRVGALFTLWSPTG